jgi:hypothetical protein
MKLKGLTLFFCVTVALCTAVPSAFGQVEKLPQIDPSQLRVLNHDSAVKRLPKRLTNGLPAGLPEGEIQGIVSTPQLTTWPYSIVAYDGNRYTGTIVGRSPFLRGKLTTTVPVVLIPLKITIHQGTGTWVGDPLGVDPGCLGGTNTAVALTQQSPLFNPSNISMGGNHPSPVFVGDTTYPDADVRASFWSAIGATASSTYHLTLSVTTEPEQSLTYTVPSGGDSDATEYVAAGQCGTNGSNPNVGGTLGVVNINVIDPQLQTIITNLGITANQFPFFILYYEVISDGAANNLSNCCILGYHTNIPPGINPMVVGQTYGISEYDIGTLFSGEDDISTMTHEVGEWIFDPSVFNMTPPWGHIGQVGGCQNNLEVGDPLTGTGFPGILMPNGITYHPQELVFFWWYFTPSSGGVNGVFSSNGTFTGDAKACPPGGTN